MGIPRDLALTTQAREPVWDPTVGIPVDNTWQGTPVHRLVTIGDSLTQGFASGAVFQTDLSYPATIAHELGWDGLRYPRYGGPGGLPLNLELLMRELAQRFGADLDWWELPMALFRGRQFVDAVEDYWERGPGAVLPAPSATNHVLAVYGWDCGTLWFAPRTAAPPRSGSPPTTWCTRSCRITAPGRHFECCPGLPSSIVAAPCSTPPPR